jgi:hypothetical protein
MPSSMARVILFCAALTAVSCASHRSAITPDEWQRMEAAGNRLTSTIEGKVWEYKMLPVHNAFWAQVYATCAPQAKAAGIGSFKAVAVIDGDGVIQQYLIQPDAKALGCFSRQMVGRKYPPPPEAPFYEVYTVRLGAE